MLSRYILVPIGISACEILGHSAREFLRINPPSLLTDKWFTHQEKADESLN